MPTAMSVAFDIASGILGFLGSIALLVTALRAAPLKELLRKVRKESQKDGPGGALIEAVGVLVETRLATIYLAEKGWLVAGAALLSVGFVCSIFSHLV